MSKNHVDFSNTGDLPIYKDEPSTSPAMSDIETKLREALDGVTLEALIAIAEGYPVRGEADRFVIVENPKFREDDGSDPNICIDTFELRDAARKMADTIASLRSKLEEAEGALVPVKPLDLANVIRDAFLAGAGMDTSKREPQPIPDDVYKRLNKYDPEHVPAYRRLDALLSAAYRARRTLASLREADHA